MDSSLEYSYALVQRATESLTTGHFLYSISDGSCDLDLDLKKNRIVSKLLCQYTF